MSVVGCYDLHLYCDGLGCDRGRFKQRAELELTDELGSACRKRAAKLGWRFLRGGHKGLCLCPSCVARKASVDPESV